MFNGCEKIYTPVLQTTKDYPEDISYRGKGLSNEYRLRHASGLASIYKERISPEVFKAFKEEILSEYSR